MEIEDDCMTIVNALNNEGYGDWNKDVIIQDARILCDTFEEWKCSHVYREGKIFVDIMANIGVYLQPDERKLLTKNWPQVMTDLANKEIANSLPLVSMPKASLSMLNQKLC